MNTGPEKSEALSSNQRKSFVKEDPSYTGVDYQEFQEDFGGEKEFSNSDKLSDARSIMQRNICEMMSQKKIEKDTQTAILEVAEEFMYKILSKKGNTPHKYGSRKSSLSPNSYNSPTKFS